MLSIRTFLVVASVVGLAAGCRSTLQPPSDPQTLWQPSADDLRHLPKKSDALTRAETLVFTNALSLAELVEQALRHSPATRMAWAAARGAAADYGVARSPYYPRIGTDNTLGPQKTFTNVDPGNQSGLAFQPGAQALWLLLDFGGRSAGAEQARNALLAQNFLFNQSMQDLLFNVAMNYYIVCGDLENLAAEQANLEDTRETLDYARQRKKVGLATALDELQAESDYDNARFRTERARGQIEVDRATLADSCGLPANVLFDVVPPVGDTVGLSDARVGLLLDDMLKKNPEYAQAAAGVRAALFDTNTVADPRAANPLIDLALNNRADVTAARAGVRASEEGVRAAASGLWPTLSLGGMAKGNWYDIAESGGAYQNVATAYVSLDWTIFDGFGNLYRKNKARARLMQARENLGAAELAGIAAMWKSYFQFRTAVRQLQFSRSFVAHAEESFRLAQQGYKAGIKGILDVLKAQSDLAAARSQLASSERDTRIALAAVAYATGFLETGDFSNREKK